MAYTVHGKGPYPNKAGEFCGNHQPGSDLPSGPYDTPESTEAREAERLAGKRFGKPSNCEHGSSAEMAKEGWVGLYLKEDRALLYFEVPVETDALTEAVVSADPDQKEPPITTKGEPK